MRRPRHRQKSSLIYKMFAPAALAGLSLAPILVGVGASQRVRSLIPVQLITIAPPKPPPVVTKAPPAPIPVAPPVAHAGRPQAPRVERVALLPSPPKKGLIRAAPPKSLPKSPVQPAPKVPPKRPVVSAKPVAPAAAARQALAARKAKADELEKRAHAMAEAIAARRTAAAGTARTAPAKPPVNMAVKPPTAPVRVAVRPLPSPPASPVTPPTPAPPDAPDSPAADVPASDYVPAEPVFQAEPTVPDRLLVAPLHAVFRCRFVVHADGSATVQTLTSTGRAVLDRRALQAARRWRFRPARRDGRPVESTRTVEMTFNVRAA